MIKTVKELTKLSNTWGILKVGLVTGCFGVVHIGHINHLEFAKRHVDILIVGVDSDRSVKLNKGQARPIFQQDMRLKFIDAIKHVDYTFLIDHGLKYQTLEINEFYKRLCVEIKITHLIVTKNIDNHYQQKQKLSKLLGLKLVTQNAKKKSSSSDIILKLGQE